MLAAIPLWVSSVRHILGSLWVPFQFLLLPLQCSPYVVHQRRVRIRDPVYPIFAARGCALTVMDAAAPIGYALRMVGRVECDVTEHR